MLIIHRSISIPSESRDAIQVLDQCLDVVMGCMRANKLNLNPDKMERLCGLGYWVWKSVLLGSHFPGKGTSVALSSFIIWGHIWQWVPISSCSWFTSYGMYKKDKVMQLYPSNLPSGLLQCIVCGAFLEDGLEAAIRSRMQLNTCKCEWEISCNSYYGRTALAACLLPFKVCLWHMKPTQLGSHIPERSTPLTQLIPIGSCVHWGRGLC